MENDRLKFRGKYFNCNKWVYGSLIVFPDGAKGIVPSSEMFYLSDGDAWDFAYIKIDPKTVGQCTDLPAAKSYRGDKPKDLLIWEGDIIKPDYGMPACIVTWHKIGWRLMQLPIEKKCKNTDCPNEKGTLCQTYAKHFQQSEIIGNIHEEQSNGKKELRNSAL